MNTPRSFPKWVLALFGTITILFSLAISVAVLLGVLWVIFGLLPSLFGYISPVVDWANHNEGFLTFVSILLGVPMALYVQSAISRNEKLERLNQAKYLFLEELGDNIVRLLTVRKSHLLQLNDDKNFRMPYFGLKTQVLELMVTNDAFEALGPAERRKYMITLSNLIEAQREFSEWKNFRMRNFALINLDTLRILGQGLTGAIDGALSSSVEFWGELVIELGNQSSRPETKLLNKELIDIKNRGQWAFFCLKSSDAKKLLESDSTKKIDEIFCVENDWLESGRKTHDLGKILTGESQ